MSVDLDPFELMRRLRGVPVEPIVEALREIHQQGRPDSERLRELLHLAKAATVVSGQKRGAGAVASTPDYESVRRHFVRHSERVREQAILAERLLDGLAGSETRHKPGILQHEVRVRCSPGSTSAARFVVVNCLDTAVDLQFVPAHLHRVSIEQGAAIDLAFNPASPHLEPGAEQVVQLLVTLAGSHDLPAVVELGVDVRGAGQLLLKQWVRIEIQQEAPGGQPGSDRI